MTTEPGELIHTRSYDTQVFLRDEAHLVVRGVLRDTKPPGMYVADDPDSLDIHEMHVELLVGIANLEILEATATMQTHPNETCPSINDDYTALVGLSIARGFNRKVRELFGGPRGCAHVTTLLQAMAPAVMQSLWSVEVRRNRVEGLPAGRSSKRGDDHPGFATNLNTCHVWSEDGDHVAAIRAGAPILIPLPISNRLKKLGRGGDDWRDPADTTD
ncbi:MAG: DUF2889 domain-containing protein [Acidimicrobiales bacterium]